ncbi:MAG: ADP-ribosylation factor-like protein [Candidatus Odinarchaeota archaeon]
MSSTKNSVQRKKRDFDFKIAVVGPARAGKTTLMQYLVEKTNFSQTAPTYGYQIEKVHYRGIDFLAFDIGGQPVFVHSFWKNHVETADAVIFVVDAGDPQSIRLSRDYLRFIASWIQKVPLMILGNKQDIADAVSKEELLQLLELGELIPSLPVTSIQMFDISAKTGTGVVDSFDWLAQRMGRIPTTARLTIHKIVVFNSSIGTPVSGIQGKIQPQSKNYLEWEYREPNDQKNAVKFLDEKTVLFSGIISAIDMMSHFLGAKTMKSITLESDNGKNLILVKETLDGLSCTLLCEEGDDLSLVRRLGKRTLEWTKQQQKSTLDTIDVQKFTEKMEELVRDLHRFVPR